VLLLANADALGWTVALMAALFIGLGLAVVRVRGRRRRSLAAAQARFGGTAVPEREDDAVTATLAFEAQGLGPARLECSLGGEGSAAHSRLEVDVASPVELVVEARGLLGGAGEPLGDDAFDGRFRVTTTPPGRGRELLDTAARAALLALHDLGAGLVSKGVRLVVGARRSTVHVPRDLLDAKPAVVVELLDLSLGLVRRVSSKS
jgi:hypothetical protein